MELMLSQLPLFLRNGAVMHEDRGPRTPHILRNCFGDRTRLAKEQALATTTHRSRLRGQRVTAGEDFIDEDFEHAFQRLSRRELEVGELIVAGHTRHEIAELLKIAMKTVEVHRRKVMDNLRADDVAHLVRLWRAWKGKK